MPADRTPVLVKHTSCSQCGDSQEISIALAYGGPGCNSQFAIMKPLHAQVEGMTCSNCSAAVEHILHGSRGVRRVNVALTLGEARVAYDPAFTDEACTAHLLCRCG